MHRSRCGFPTRTIMKPVSSEGKDRVSETRSFGDAIRNRRGTGQTLEKRTRIGPMSAELHGWARPTAQPSRCVEAQFKDFLSYQSVHIRVIRVPIPPCSLATPNIERVNFDNIPEAVIASVAKQSGPPHLRLESLRYARNDGYSSGHRFNLDQFSVKNFYEIRGMSAQLLCSLARHDDPPCAVPYCLASGSNAALDGPVDHEIFVAT